MRWISFFLLALFLGSISAYAHVPREFEPTYAEAILAYHDRNYSDALRLLLPILKSHPKSEEVLELAALTARALGQDAHAERLYGDLLGVMRERSAASDEVAPYEFELAVVSYQQRKSSQSRRLFQRVIQQSFNLAACYFYLGMLALQDGYWSEAIDSFGRIADTDPIEISIPARLQLAQAYFGQNDLGRAVGEYRSLEQQFRDPHFRDSLDEKQRKMFDRARKSMEHALATLSTSRWIASVGLFTGYDSNVFTIANDSKTSGGTLRSTLKETLNANIGYSSGLLQRWHAIAVYRGSANYNFNGKTKSAQFFDNEVTGILTRGPLEDFQYGARLAADYAFQYDSARSRYEPSTESGLVSPFMKLKLGQRWVAMAECETEYVNDLQDKDTRADYRRSGWGAVARVDVNRDRKEGFLNPGWEISAGSRWTLGNEFRVKTITLELKNSIYPIPRFQMLTSLFLEGSSFGDRPRKVRFDSTMGGRLSMSYKTLASITFLSDFQYVRNASNEIGYRYSRFTVLMGALYTF